MSKELIEKREEMVERIRQELRALVRESSMTQREIEEQNGFTARYLSQVLQGHITLTVRHLCGLLLAFDLTLEQFFGRVFGPPATAPDYAEIAERLERYDAALEELEKQGFLNPRPAEEDV